MQLTPPELRAYFELEEREDPGTAAKYSGVAANAEGTCEAGQRADLTGCTPASGPAGGNVAAGQHRAAADQAAQHLTSPDAPKGLLAKVRAAISPSNILNAARRLAIAARAAPGAIAHAVTHPKETIEKVRQAAAAKFAALRERYGTAGAVAIAGAYVGYQAVAATLAATTGNLAMYAVPLTPSLLGSAEALRLLASPSKIMGAAQVARKLTGNVDGAPDLDAILTGAKQYIAELAEVSGEPAPELSDALLREVLRLMLEEQGGEEGGADGSVAAPAEPEEHKP